MEEPPPLCSLSMLDEDNQRNEIEEEKSIMDEMVQVATQAKEIKRAAKIAEQKKRNKAFGNGLKKGFFSNAKPLKEKHESNQPEIPTIRRNPASNSLKLPEVQAAMSEMQNLKPEDWMTPDLFEKLAKDPKLSQALQNPRFTAAIQEMSTNPTAAMLKYQNDPDVGVMFKDFMNFMGHHFEHLGKIEEEKERKSREEIQRDALKSMSTSPEEDAQVQRILADPELMDILGDPAMQQVLHACQKPCALRSYMNDAIYGPKIRKLADAGLVQLHP
ncbi:unnamed protein product [Aphanomyces euteiches]|uniref:STI1 domain-containing protein n=1 Tax=Aphanomyces euteiches TaxID=100861 RepID=A0A6G0XYI5_9STRA|nr:hypothetical protein Ae201684_000042 [Aphanomyces euteiches]KAH9091939.1 hypothetical protein Ae201684P_011480 [Aphanomyces euteiches]